MKSIELKQFIRSGGYAWPGGYPMILIMSDGAIVSAKGARMEFKLIIKALKENDKRSDWFPVGIDIHWEGEPEICAITGELIESAYGE